MIEAMNEIPTSAGRMEAFVVHPEEGGPFPAVVLFMDIWGLREELFDIARKIAVVGYHCTLPNMYYRQGAVRFEVRDERGRMASFAALQPDLQSRMIAQRRSLTDEMVVEDTKGILTFMKTQPVRRSAKGSIGYCMGGRHALCVAATYPEEFQAAATLHGTSLVNETPLSPHRLAASYRGEIYGGFGERDAHAPMDTIEALATALQGRGNVRYRYNVHPGAEHGYALPDRDVFDKQAANRDWEAIFAMYRRVLAG